jgi:hypothetical protein
VLSSYPPSSIDPAVPADFPTLVRPTHASDYRASTFAEQSLPARGREKRWRTARGTLISTEERWGKCKERWVEEVEMIFLFYRKGIHLGGITIAYSDMMNVSLPCLPPKAHTHIGGKPNDPILFIPNSSSSCRPSEETHTHERGSVLRAFSLFLFCAGFLFV